LPKTSRQRLGSAAGAGKSGIPLATSQHRPHLLQYSGAFMPPGFKPGICPAGPKGALVPGAATQPAFGFFLHFLTSLNIATRSLTIFEAITRLARGDKFVHHFSLFNHPRLRRI